MAEQRAVHQILHPGEVGDDGLEQIVLFAAEGIGLLDIVGAAQDVVEIGGGGLAVGDEIDLDEDGDVDD